MASLITVKGPNIGQRYRLDSESTTIGRQPDAPVYLDSLAVSRQHARVLSADGKFFVEDLGSSNGTYLNSIRITSRTPLTEKDTLQIGPYVLVLRDDRHGGGTPQSTPSPEITSNVTAHVDALPGNTNLFTQNAAYKLRVVLEIAQHLGHHLDAEPLLLQLLDQLLRLFPQADRGMVLLCEDEGSGGKDTGDPAGLLRVRAQRTRQPNAPQDFPYSRSLVRRALTEGVGLLSEDVGVDPKIVLSSTMVSLRLRSFMCVPLLGKDQKRLGVLQLDCLRIGEAFRKDDLEVLTALCLQVAVVLENAALHAESMRQARLQQEVLLARDIQQAFLPNDFAALEKDRRLELFARVQPAREVSGDLYDLFPLADGRLAFLLGDVSGKGMPAALFMIAVRTLSRHLAPSASGPSDLLRRLHTALVADNPTSLYVTLVHGIYDPHDGSVVFATAAHPAPLLRRANGMVEELPVTRATMIGNEMLTPRPVDATVKLAPGETFIGYSDGLTEAKAKDETMFGLERLKKELGGRRTELPLPQCADEVSAEVRHFTGQVELQDDQTLLLLRRR
jgi:serine phosphatase RsbU (regulator of sigma subunit)/pSer/pThr/pTyr-binding forkhead associated (FHA) protein